MADGQELSTDVQPRAISSSQALSDTAQMLSMIRDLALNPDVDAAKFETIARVAREAKADAKREQFYAAKASAILEMPVIDKRGRIVIEKTGQASRVQGTFAKWPDLQRTVVPILARHDLILTHDLGHEGSIVLVTPVLQHRNGFVERGEAMQLPLDTSGGKNNTQGAASASSYGKRHTTVAMLGLRLEDSDDDGQLMALPDEPLNDQQQRLVAVAEARAAKSGAAYADWFAEIERRDQAWLITTGRDDRLREAAALPPAGKAATSPTPTPAPAPPPPKHDVRTPAGWAGQYVDDVTAATSLADLAGIQAKAAPALKKLARDHPALHDDTKDADAKAFRRLSADDDAGGGDQPQTLFGDDA